MHFLTWKTGNISTKTKLQLFNSNVKSILLYGSETWSITNQTENKIQVFINKCLRKILKIYWSERISNVNLWAANDEHPIPVQIRRQEESGNGLATH